MLKESRHYVWESKSSKHKQVDASIGAAVRDTGHSKATDLHVALWSHGPHMSGVRQSAAQIIRCAVL